MKGYKSVKLRKFKPVLAKVIKLYGKWGSKRKTLLAQAFPVVSQWACRGENWFQLATPYGLMWFRQRQIRPLAC